MHHDHPAETPIDDGLADLAALSSPGLLVEEPPEADLAPYAHAATGHASKIRRRRI